VRSSSPSSADSISPRFASESPHLTAERAPVVRFVNSSRTQNGHIRNDTRDASRRILNAQKAKISGETVPRVIARVRA